MAISTQDIIKGLDITGLVTLNSSQIQQITDAAIVGNDRGIIVESQDSALNVPLVPDATVRTKFKRYIWKRRSFLDASKVKLYYWDDFLPSDATLLRWTEITADIADLTALINQAIEDSAEALTKANIAITQSGTAITVANDALTVANETSDRVDVVEDAIDPLAISKIAPSTTALQILRTKADLSAVEWVDAILTQLEAIGAAFQIPRVKEDLTGIEWTTAPLTKLSALGTALQILRTNAAADAAEWVAPSLASVTESYTELSPATLATEISFAHGLGVVPSVVQVSLVCIEDDAGTSSVVGDVFPSECILTAAGLPNCSITYNAISIDVTIVVAPYAYATVEPAPTTLGSINAAKWNIKVRAYV